MLHPSLKEDDERASRSPAHRAEVENSNDDQRVIGGHHGRTVCDRCGNRSGLVSKDGERVSTVLMINDRCFRLSIEPALADTLPELRNAMPPIVRQ